MIGAFLVVCLVFNVWTDGRFLTPRNIFNLTIQTVSVAIMATGMVFVIVTRHIDLSVGALLATCTAVMGMLQTRWLPGYARDRDRLAAHSLDHHRARPAHRRHHRRNAGLAGRISWHSGLHRDAGRPAGLAQCRLVSDQRPDHRPAGRHLYPFRRHHRHAGRWTGAGSSASPPRWSLPSVSGRRGAPRSATNFRSSRSGPNSR